MAVRHREEGTLGRGQWGEEEDNRKVFYHDHSTGNVTFDDYIFVKLRRGSGKDRQGMAVKEKGLKA